MELPATIRRRIQAAMPLLVPSRPISAPCHLPTLSSAALTSLQPSTPSPGPHQRIIPSRVSNSSSGRSKSLASQDLDMEIDLWTLLEDGTSSAPSMSSGSNMGGTSGDHSNLKACSWLKGTVRVQRTDLTYIGALDEDSWPCTIILTMEHWQPQERSCELHFHTDAMGYIIFCCARSPSSWLLFWNCIRKEIGCHAIVRSLSYVKHPQTAMLLFCCIYMWYLFFHQWDE